MQILLLLILATAPQDADAKVREAIGTLEKALVAKDESIGDLIEMPRLLREMERRGAIPDSNLRFRSARRLEENLGTIVYTAGALNGGWNKIEPLSVKVNAGGDEAEALCRVTIGGKKSKFRIWLTRGGDSWKTFDLENLDGTYRLSVIGLQYTPGVHDDDERTSLRDGVQAFQRGAVYLSKGQPDAARDAFSMARRCSPPEYVLDWVELVDGQAMSAMGDHLGSLKSADKVLTRQKDLAVAHRLKATSHAALKEHAKAIAAAKEYLKVVGDDAEMWTLIGRESQRLGQTDAAIEAYRKAAGVDAEHADSRWELGCLLLERRKTAEAAVLLSDAARLAPVAEDVFENAADLLDAAGAHAEALALAEEAVKRRPEDATVLSRQGRALRTVGRLKEAEDILRGATKIHPENKEIVQELVLVLAQSGKDAAAQERIKTVASGDYWYSCYLRAFAHAAAGRSPKALEELKTVLAAEGDLHTTVAWVEKEPVFEKLRADKEGKALLDPARATRDYWLARENPGRTPEQMLKIAQDRIQAVPDYALAHYDQGLALKDLRRFPEAEAAIRKAIEKSGDKTLYRDALGRTLAAQGKLEEALGVAEALPAPAGVDLRVAVYAIAGKRELAVKSLQVLLEKHPDWFPAAVTGAELDEFRRLPAVQDLLRKARAKTRK
jgi:tetratricopeptide (TPR) repeat protein